MRTRIISTVCLALMTSMAVANRQERKVYTLKPSISDTRLVVHVSGVTITTEQKIETIWVNETIQETNHVPVVTNHLEVKHVLTKVDRPTGFWKGVLMVVTLPVQALLRPALGCKSCFLTQDTKVIEVFEKVPYTNMEERISTKSRKVQRAIYRDGDTRKEKIPLISGTLSVKSSPDIVVSAEAPVKDGSAVVAFDLDKIKDALAKNEDVEITVTYQDANEKLTASISQLQEIKKKLEERQ